MTQHTGDRGGRTRVQRPGRLPPEPLQVGGAAVAPHDHHGCIDTGGRDALGDHVGDAHGDRQDRRVECRRHGPEFEAVEARHLRRGTHGQAVLGGDGRNPGLVVDVLGRERLGNAHGNGALGHEPLHDRCDRRLVEPIGHVEELADRPQALARREFDVVERRALARLAKVGPAAHADDTDEPHVTFEQRVDRLRGRVGHERDRSAVQRFGDIGDHTHDALRHAVVVLVGGRPHRLRHDAGRVDRDGLRERAADVDADPDRRDVGHRPVIGSAHAEAAIAGDSSATFDAFGAVDDEPSPDRRLRRGRITNM